MARKRLLNRIKDGIAAEGLVPRTRAARNWLREKIKQVRMPGAAKYTFVNASNKSLTITEFAHKVAAGYVRMFFFFYDPKTKDKLPYYDIFPLVIPIASYPDGFLGLNLHYIHPNHRVVLLDKLETILTDNRFDERTKFEISYRLIKQNSRFYQAMPCIKRYLYTHVRSHFLELDADEWEISVLLPFEDFKKQPKRKVWADSIKKYKR
jgi:hypothetical protein